MPEIKTQIKVTYIYYLDQNNITEALNDGKSPDDIKRDVKYRGIKSRFVTDYNIDEVESILKES
jgi:hypothetical protein